MKTERNRIAEQLRAEGRETAEKIELMLINKELLFWLMLQKRLKK